MIEIRLDQLQVFHEKVRAAYVKRVCSYLRKKRREWVRTFANDALEASVRRQVIAAESFGIASETGVVRFIEVGLVLGEDFYSSGRYPEAERVLLHAGLDPDKKLQELEMIINQAAVASGK
jgi:hypothetical protein